MSIRISKIRMWKMQAERPGDRVYQNLIGTGYRLKEGSGPTRIENMRNSRYTETSTKRRGGLSRKRLYEVFPMAEENTKNEMIEQKVDVQYYPDLTAADVVKAGMKEFPITELGAVGAAFSMLPEAARTITAAVDTGGAAGQAGLYWVDFNGKVGTLAAAKDGSGYLGTIMNHGIVGQSRLTKASIASKVTVPFNPTMLLMAAALIDIKVELNEIRKTGKEILEYLQERDAAELRADLRTLIDINDELGDNWGNEVFVNARITTIEDIRNRADAKIQLTRQQIVKKLPDDRLPHANQQLKDAFAQIQLYYRMYLDAVYNYAFASYLDAMLLGNYSAEYLEKVKDKISDRVREYNELYGACYNRMQNFARTSVEAGALKGLAKASKMAGNIIHSIPVIEKGPIDEALVDAGDKIKKLSCTEEDKALQKFGEFADTRTAAFTTSIAKVEMIQTSTEGFLTDGEKIYIGGGE